MSTHILGLTNVQDTNRELNIILYRAPGEANEPKDVQDLLRSAKIKTLLWTYNPITGDLWHLALEVARQPAATGAVLLGILKLWVDHMKGRRIEIQRGNTRIKVPSLSVLKKTLKALHRYEHIQLTIRKTKPKRRESPARKTRRARRARVNSRQ